jgi:hypothetical protein
LYISRFEKREILGFWQGQVVSGSLGYEDQMFGKQIPKEEMNSANPEYISCSPVAGAEHDSELGLNDVQTEA